METIERARLCSLQAWVDALQDLEASVSENGQDKADLAFIRALSRLLDAAQDADSGTCVVYLALRSLIDARSTIDVDTTVETVRQLIRRLDSRTAGRPIDAGTSCGSPLSFRIRQFLEKHYRDRCQLHGIARALGAPMRKTSEVFRETFGCRIHEYVTMLRLTHALRLMTSTENKLYTIAVESGFGSVSSLERALRWANPEDGRPRRHRSAAWTLLSDIEDRRRLCEGAPHPRQSTTSPTSRRRCGPLERGMHS